MLVKVSLCRTVWVKLNCLRTGVGVFPFVNEQTADHVLTMYPIHRAPYGAQGLTVLNDGTDAGLTPSC